MLTEATVPTVPAALGNADLLSQAVELLERMPASAYATRPGAHSSIGAQVRHVLDHYQALVEGLAEGRVDYDARRRDPVLEHDPVAAAAAARRWRAHMHALAHADADTPLVVRMDAGGPGGDEEWRGSTLGRELQVVASHTIHHFALVGLLLEHLAVPVPPGFGVAPSTRRHQAQAR